jgi:hypothetical protein
MYLLTVLTNKDEHRQTHSVLVLSVKNLHQGTSKDTCTCSPYIETKLNTGRHILYLFRAKNLHQGTSKGTCTCSTYIENKTEHRQTHSVLVQSEKYISGRAEVHDKIKFWYKMQNM